MVWRRSDNSWGGFSDAVSTWLPVAEPHLSRAGLDEAERSGSVYCQFAEFLTWRKAQPAMMRANNMTLVASGPKEIVFDRMSETQNLRCRFDFETLTASIAEI
jgi:alpha-glucosidase